MGLSAFDTSIDLNRDGQSAPHPEYARHVNVEVGPGAGKQMVRAHVRGAKNIPPHFRSKPQSMAPYTNPDVVD